MTSDLHERYSGLISELHDEVERFGDGDFKAIWRNVDGVDCIVDYLPVDAMGIEHIMEEGDKLVVTRATCILEQVKSQCA